MDPFRGYGMAVLDEAWTPCRKRIFLREELLALLESTGRLRDHLLTETQAYTRPFRQSHYTTGGCADEHHRRGIGLLRSIKKILWKHLLIYFCIALCLFYLLPLGLGFTAAVPSPLYIGDPACSSTRCFCLASGIIFSSPRVFLSIFLCSWA